MFMTNKNNVVAKTIKTYEELAEDYYKTHFYMFQKKMRKILCLGSEKYSNLLDSSISLLNREVKKKLSRKMNINGEQNFLPSIMKMNSKI